MINNEIKFIKYDIFASFLYEWKEKLLIEKLGLVLMIKCLILQFSGSLLEKLQLVIAILTI